MRPQTFLSDWSVAVGAILGLLMVPATNRMTPRRPSQRALALGLAATAIASLLLGLACAAYSILDNRYLTLGMSQSAIGAVETTLTRTWLVACAAYLAAAAISAVLAMVCPSRRLLRFAQASLPVLVIYGLGSYLLDRGGEAWALGQSTVTSEVLWAVLCVGALWPVAWVRRRLWALIDTLPSRATGGSVLSWTALPVLLLLAASHAPRPTAVTHPGVILISIDTLRADHLGAYGYPRRTSPNLDRFSESGVLFENVVAQAPWTLPSHMSILTGLYATNHGAGNRGRRLAPRFVTAAEILREAGYQTVAITGGGWVDERLGYQGFEYFDDRGEPINSERTVENSQVDQRAATTTVDKAIRFLLERSGRRPFLLFLHTYQVHCPYNPPPEWDLFSDRDYDGLVRSTTACLGDLEEIKPRMTSSDYQHIIDKYDGEIAYVDHELGRLFETLDTLGLLETSVIIVTSDHGENFDDHPGHKLGHEGQLYDHTVRVPLIVRAPGLPRGAVVQAQVESIDIAPTLLDIIGLDAPSPMDGTSLLPPISTGLREREYAYSEGLPAHRTIRSERWKLILHTQGRAELYNLADDPAEQNNVLRENLDQGHFLRRELQRWIAEMERRSGTGDAEFVVSDEDLEDRLRSLGYVQ